MPAIRVPGDSTYPPRNVVGATLRVLKTSYRCPSSTQARVSTLHGCYKPALVPRDRSLHIARRAVAPGAEPPAGVLARPLRPSTTDSASIPAAHVHGRPRAPRPASHARVSRRGEFFTVLERSWRRGGARSPFPSTRPAARSRPRFARTRLRPRLPHSPPWRRAKASRKSSDPCFRRSRRLDGRSRQKKGRGVFLEGLRRPRPGFGSIRSRPNLSYRQGRQCKLMGRRADSRPREGSVEES